MSPDRDRPPPAIPDPTRTDDERTRSRAEGDPPRATRQRRIGDENAPTAPRRESPRPRRKRPESAGRRVVIRGIRHDPPDPHTLAKVIASIAETLVGDKHDRAPSVSQESGHRPESSRRD